MNKQTANTILMIEPVAFTYNEQTAVNNYFQQQPGSTDATSSQTLALAEFKNMVEVLKKHGIRVITIQDTLEPHTPDSIFPNNWVSFHEDGRLVLYPMYAENRRTERRDDLIDILEEQGFICQSVIDYSDKEQNNIILEGTGSMVLDRVNKIAYATLSPRTDKTLFELFCKDLGYTPHSFTSYHTVEGERKVIYHTNVMMCVGSQYVVVCLEGLDNPTEREALENCIKQSGKVVIPITEEQMNHFAGNMLQVENDEGKLFLAMSETAYNSLDPDQLILLDKYNEILHMPIPTIETLGGGSVRCMMAEVFLPFGK